MDNDEEVKRAILKSIHFFKKSSQGGCRIWNMPDIPSRYNVKNQRKIPQYFCIYQKGWHGKICSNPRLCYYKHTKPILYCLS